MSSESYNFLRALRLFWVALGRARFYVAGAIGVVLLLATIGFWHLLAQANRSGVSSANAVAKIAPGISSSSPSSILNPPSSPSPPQLERAIAITELTEAEERGPRGETFIVAKIGMASRTTEEKDNIEIRVLFFDLDASNKMRPTDARVTYQWITPVRDWADPAPKYLAATYLQRRTQQRLRYGGFVVRVYCDGKLQDERSKPESLIASLRTNAPPSVTADTAPSFSPPSISPSPSPTSDFQSPTSANSPSPPSSILNSPSSPSPPSSAVSSPPSISSPSPTSDNRPQTSESLPYGKPIPGKPGFVQSPYDPKFIIDVRGFPPGTLVNDPNTNKPFRVP